MTPGFLDFPSKIYATVGVLLVAYISQGSKLTVPPSCIPWIKRKKKNIVHNCWELPKYDLCWSRVTELWKVNESRADIWRCIQVFFLKGARDGNILSFFW